MLHPIQQSGQVCTIFIPDCCEFQTDATTGIYMPHDGLGSDLSFLDEKLKSCACTQDIWLARFDEQTTRAQIPNSRSVIAPTAAPVNPDALRCLDSRSTPSGRGSWLLQHMTHLPRASGARTAGDLRRNPTTKKVLVQYLKLLFQLTSTSENQQIEKCGKRGRKGLTIKARTRYQDFLSLWKDADPDVPILIAARAEYEKSNQLSELLSGSLESLRSLANSW